VRHAFNMRRRDDASDKPPKTTVDQFPDVNRDYAIMAQYVRIPNPGGGLSPPESLRSAMSRVRRGTEHLVQISRVDEDGMAICRIMTIADLVKQKRDKARVQKEHKKSLKQSAPKQIELNWAIGPNDLEHKLTQLKGFIEDGKKVEVVLANKKRQRQATPEEGREVLKKVKAKLAEADGREINQMQGGVVGRHTVLTVRKKGLE
jgi:translation initiation factor IF-3